MKESEMIIIVCNKIIKTLFTSTLKKILKTVNAHDDNLQCYLHVVGLLY